MFNWLYQRIADNIVDLIEDDVYDELMERMDDLEEQQELYQADIRSQILPTLQRVNNREAVRASRSKTLNTDESQQRTGIMRGTPK